MKYELNVTIETDDSALENHARRYLGNEFDDDIDYEEYLMGVLDRIFCREFIDYAYVTGVREIKD